MKYLARIAYIGTEFSGFQIQPKERTVMGTLSSALALLFGAEPTIKGCSRTDSGVHATGFCVTIECDKTNIPPERLALAAIPYMPNDLSIMEAIEVDDSFHVRYDVKTKTYLYRIYNSRTPHPMEYKRAWFLPQLISEEGIDVMRVVSRDLIGTHDFSSFMAEGSDVVSTVRTIEDINIEKNNNVICIRIRADGFLYNMVRIIVGTLVDMALNRKCTHTMKEILESKNRALAGMTAPAEGLYLEKIVYKNGFSF